MTFIKGSYIEPSNFAYNTYWKALHDFLGHTDHVSKRQWGLILEFEKEAAHDEDDDYGMDESRGWWNANPVHHMGRGVGKTSLKRV